MKNLIIAATLAATTTLTATIPGQALAQEPQPTNDTERATESFYDSLGTGGKIALGLGILAVCAGAWYYLSTSEEAPAEGESQANKTPTVPPETALLPIDITAWAGKGEGGIGLSGSW